MAVQTTPQKAIALAIVATVLLSMQAAPNANASTIDDVLIIDANQALEGFHAAKHIEIKEGANLTTHGLVLSAETITVTGRTRNHH
jgi:hypothetical protein